MRTILQQHPMTFLTPLAGHLMGMKMKSSDDKLDKLIHAVAQRSCQASFQQLFLILSPKLYAYGLKAGLGKAQALELCQEVMLKVWKKAKTYDPLKGNFKSWLFTIARNSRFDELRKKRKDPLALSSGDVYKWQESEGLLDSELSMEEIYQNSQLREQINQLPEDQKKVILSIYAEGQTQAEYSQAENIPLGTVKSRVRLAMKSLRKGLSE